MFRADIDGPMPRGTRYNWARDLALEMVPHAAAVLLSDYDKGFLTPHFIRQVSDECMRRGVPCVADCKRAPATYPGCILKGNAGWGREHRLEAINRGLYVETRGRNSPWVWEDRRHAVVSRGMQPAPCRNHVGAGDCFAAHLALALAYGFTVREAAALAHSAGRVYVRFPYNRPPYPDEVAADLEGVAFVSAM